MMFQHLTSVLFLGVGDGPSPERIHKALRGVFARREFDRTPPLVDLQQLLKRFFEWLGSLSGTAPVLYWLLLIGCIMLLALLVWHIVWTVFSAFSYGRRARQDENVKQRRRLSVSYAAAADKAAAAGDYTEAVRCLFLCLVHNFDESGRLTYLPSGTNREYLGQFSDRPAVYRDLAVFVDTLDDNWYGQRPTPPEQYRLCLERYDSIHRFT
jgi:Domain of unknown function (DUF4129)